MWDCQASCAGLPNSQSPTETTQAPTLPHNVTRPKSTPHCGVQAPHDTVHDIKDGAMHAAVATLTPSPTRHNGALH